MAQYFENDARIKSNEKTHTVVIRNAKFSFITDNGVFSKRGLDYGTRSLLESIPFSEIHGKVLDFGCGYGPIGIVIRKLTDAEVVMVDVNERALQLAYKNAALNQVLLNLKVSNLYENVDEIFDFIITNPPIRVGKQILYEILLGAKKHLSKHGVLYFVIHKDQGAKTVIRDLESTYHVSVVAREKGFFVIKAEMI